LAINIVAINALGPCALELPTRITERSTPGVADAINRVAARSLLR
jgi:hypothetical protein